ncbi:BMP-binding endothelial regulator protein-like [Saccoglossus kowalevskii]|uniref:IgGFc-binding protein-like n=1 Tax=Saccoglossus kowalevskii TaxID=10224 RepID=A0ABM0MRB5_SACKO|nr:PREDICTED: IgGFc-binding protein-like [Saccoglossus kowalevskii]
MKTTQFMCVLFLAVTVQSIEISHFMKRAYKGLDAPDKRQDDLPSTFDCKDHGGNCRQIKPSGDNCMQYEMEDSTGVCNTGASCCVHDCNDDLSGCGSCETPYSHGDHLCPPGKIVYPGKNCKCSDAGKICCTVDCETALNDTCRLVFQGLCKPVTCPAGYVAREDPECCGGLKHCKCCKGMTKLNGTDIPTGSMVNTITGTGTGEGAKPGAGVRGDPVLETLDHLIYRFDGQCSYVLVRECSNPNGHAAFKVISQHIAAKDRTGAFTTMVHALSIFADKIGGGEHEIELFIGKEISINKKPRESFENFTTFEDYDNDIRVYRDGTKVCVSKKNVFDVWYNGIGRVDVNINPDSIKVCGLLGNGNGDPYDDFQKWTPWGLELIPLFDLTEIPREVIAEFGYTWKLTGDPDCNEVLLEY